MRVVLCFAYTSNGPNNSTLVRMTNDQLLRLATYASVATATVLVFAKLVAWFATGSVSIMASLVDSLMDVGASLVNLFAVRYSLQPADQEHRFGHGKAEALAGLGQATFITLISARGAPGHRPAPLYDQ